MFPTSLKHTTRFAPAKALLGALLFWGTLLFINPVLAQTKLEQAQVLWGKREYTNAIAALQKEVSRRSTPPSLALLGDWLYQRGRWTEAAAVLENADATDSNPKKPLTLQLLKAQLRAGNWAKAQSLAAQRPAQLQNPEGQRWRAAANGPQKAPAGSLAPQPLGAYLNSEAPEYFPLRATDAQSITFTRRVNGMNDKLLRATADSCADWFYGEPLPYPLNSTQQESGPALSADGHYLFLARGEMRSGDGWSGGGSDLFMAYSAARTDSTWSIPEPFGATINTPATETAPALAADNRTLYFASDRPGGLGGLDLWYSHFENGRWQEALNLGPGINSAGNETAPFLCADGQTLYFSSDGRLPTLGGYDLYRARHSGESWSAAEHLPAPFNGPGDELSCSTTPAGDTLYFATDRQGPVGNLDIWMGQLPAEMRPQPVHIVQARVRDSLTRQLLPNALVEVKESTTGQFLGIFTSNRGDASLTLFLHPAVDYKLSISRNGYLPFETLWNTDSIYAGEGVRSLALLPDTYVPPTYDSLLVRIHFQKNERSLSDSLREEVAYALAPWRGVAGAQILLWGFTDNSGTPLLNEELSALRTALVGHVARQVGLEGERITEQGWGEVSPMGSNDTEEGRYLNRRVEIIVRRPVRGK